MSSSSDFPYLSFGTPSKGDIFVPSFTFNPFCNLLFVTFLIFWMSSICHKLPIATTKYVLF